MNFLIADTFQNSLARLTGDEQKAAKTTANDLQVNLAALGLCFHKIEKSNDKHLWAVRVNLDGTQQPKKPPLGDEVMKFFKVYPYFERTEDHE